MSSNILDTIIAAKRIEVKNKKRAVSVSTLEGSAFFNRQTISLKESLISGDRSGIIAEFKRRSPSKGLFNGHASARAITQAYADLGASAVSVLTDVDFFGGSDQDLIDSRNISIPILRKDFIVDEYQILEARSIGADLILLIAANLTPQEVNQLGGFAKRLGLEVLLELHAEDELGHVSENVDIVGVNNRDLKTFTVNLHRSIELAKKIPTSFPLISESGIRDAGDINLLKSEGFSGFLIGETFMKEADPAIAFATFIKQLKHSQE
jgi:indole-3-glycerol phosphate synthase